MVHLHNVRRLAVGANLLAWFSDVNLHRHNCQFNRVDRTFHIFRNRNRGSSMSQIRRRQILVDAKLQGTLVFHALLYWLYCLLTVSVIATVWIVFSRRPPSSAQLFEELWTNCGPALLGSIMLLPLVLLDCLRQSNRFAGPMLRLHRAIEELADGETPRHVKLRKDDFWNEFAESVNRLIDSQVAKRDENGVTESANRPAPAGEPASVNRNATSLSAATIYGELTP